MTPSPPSLHDLQWIDPIDRAFAKRWTEDPILSLFLCYLFSATRQGHICVFVDDNTLDPPPKEMGLFAQMRRGETPILPPSAEEEKALVRMILEGSRQLPPPLCSQGIHRLKTPVVQQKNRFYIHRNFFYETILLQHLNRILQSPPSSPVAVDPQLLADLLPRQQQAVKHALSSPFTLLTGGPGTGKTYTAGKILLSFWKNLSTEHRTPYSIALAAPTGKAASQLEESLHRAFANEKESPPIQAQTLHRLLGIGRSLRWEDHPIELSYDLILIDESSMIDLPMMAHLLQRVKKGARIVLLGDSEQLPSIESGSVFRDWIHKLPSHVTVLEKSLRAENTHLLTMEQSIRKGTLPHDFSFLPLPKDDTPLRQQYQTLLQHILPYLSPEIPLQEETYLSFFQQFRLLTPLRKGKFGVEALNKTLLHAISHNHAIEHPLVSPIIITQTNERHELYNGDGGVLIHPPSQKNYALFPPRRGESNLRRFSPSLLPPYEYAYALSIHKSQGSEFDNVFCLLPLGSEIFGREILYTAVTRARKTLTICSSKETIQKCLSKTTRRLSGIGEETCH